MLTKKLYIPATIKDMVDRPRLLDKLDKGIEKKLILISAPAGFGKTTIICDWILKNNVFAIRVMPPLFLKPNFTLY